MVRNADIRPKPPSAETMAFLERPAHRMGHLPPPRIKPWFGSDNSGKPFAVKHKELEQHEVKERNEYTLWLRAGQEGGVEGLAKKLNKSITYVKKGLNGFETTNGIHRWVPNAKAGKGVPGVQTGQLRPQGQLSSSMNETRISTPTPTPNPHQPTNQRTDLSVSRTGSKLNESQQSRPRTPASHVHSNASRASH